MYYVEKDTFIHRLNPLDKFFIFIIVTIITFIFYNPWLCFIITAFFTVLIALAGTFRAYSKMVVVIVPIISALLVFQIFAPALPKVVKSFEVKLPGFTLIGYQEGLYHGLVLTGRILAIVAAGALMITTSHPADIVASLRYIRLPYLAGFIITTSLQYVPILQREFVTILEAQQSRGFKTKGFKALIPTLIPLFLISLQRVRQLALTLESRGFGSSGKKTSLREVKPTLKDYAVLAISFGMFSYSIWYRVSVGTLSQIEEFYLPTMTLYGLTLGFLILFMVSVLFLFLRHLRRTIY
ncbi:hypothetical protein DRO64_01690 [Candidatus Bathyarchaeota archaeon]|nr:MAG: hypothetical protein DRO64_01690 [Candidatus Bathyarchaeota archaeon]